MGNEDTEIPPTPHTSDTLLENQAHIGWQPARHGRSFFFTLLELFADRYACRNGPALAYTRNPPERI